MFVAFWYSLPSLFTSQLPISGILWVGEALSESDNTLSRSSDSIFDEVLLDLVFGGKFFSTKGLLWFDPKDNYFV